MPFYSLPIIYMNNNPFLNHNKPRVNVLAMAMNRSSNPPNPSQEQKNVFLPLKKANEEDPQNNRNQINAPKLIQIAQKPQIIKPVIKVPSLSISNNFEVRNDNAKIQMKLNSQACKIRKIKDKQLNRVEQLNCQNLEIKLPEGQCQKINKVIRETSIIINCLNSLYQIIKGNNQNIYQYISKMRLRKRGDLEHVRLSAPQHKRLSLGLLFYRKVSNHAILVLTQSLKNHIFGKLTFLIAERFNLDALIAYYVVRSIHENKNIIDKHSSTFFVSNKIKPIEQAEALELAHTFLFNDKISLLMTYSEFIKFYKLVEGRYSRTKNELYILWANATMIQNESARVQQLAIQVLLQYWSLTQSREIKSELQNIRSYILGRKLPQNLKNMLIQKKYDDILSQDISSISKQDFQGPHQDLYQLFIQQNQDHIDFEVALNNIATMDVSRSWFEHIKRYVQKVKFMNEGRKGILKCIYLLKVLMKLKEKNVNLKIKQQQELTIKIINECSIIVGIIYLMNIFKQLSSATILSLLLKYPESSLYSKYQRQKGLIFKFSEIISLQSMFEAQLSMIQSTIKKYIEMGDIGSIQRQVSIGKTFYFDFEDETSNYQFMKAYSQFLLKSKDNECQILANIHEIFRVMKENEMRTERSIYLYHAKLIKSTINIPILISHLTFLYRHLQDNNTLADYSSDWIEIIQREDLVPKVDRFSHILCMVGQRVIENDQFEMLSVYTRFITLFAPSIDARLSNKLVIDGQIVEMYFTMKKIVEWGKTNNLGIQSMTQICKKIKMCILRECQNLNEVLSSIRQLNPAIKLFLLCQIVCKQNIITPNSLNSFLTFHPHFKVELYQLINQELKSLTRRQFLQTFSYAALCDQQLLKTMISQNVTELHNFLKQASSNLSEATYLLNIGKTISNMIKRGSQKSFEHLLSSIIYQILVSFDKKLIPPVIFERLLDISMQLMNRIQYSKHIQILAHGSKKGNTPDLTQLDQQLLSKYFLYLICLFIARFTKINLQSGKERQRIAQQIYIFTNFTKFFLRNDLAEEAICIQYLRKYLQIFQYLVAIPIMSQFASTQFLKLKNQMKDSRLIQSQFLSEVIMIQKMIEQEEARQAYLDYKDVDNDNVNDEFNIILSKFAKQKDAIVQDRLGCKIEQLLQKHLAKLIVNNPADLDLLLAKWSHNIYAIGLIADNIDFNKNKREVIKLLKRYIFQFDIKSCKTNELSSYKTVQSYLQIYNILIKNSAISAYTLVGNSSGQQNKMVELLSEIKSMMMNWIGPSNNKFDRMLDNIKLQVDDFYSDAKLKSINLYQKQLSLWNILLLRQKLRLASVVSTFYQIMNGILPKGNYKSINNFTAIIYFFSEKYNQLSKQNNTKKISAMNNLIRTANMKLPSYLSFFYQQIDLLQMGKLCKNVMNTLCNIDAQIQPKIYNSVDKFNDQKDS